MAHRQLALLLLDGTFAICRLECNASIPAWAFAVFKRLLPGDARHGLGVFKESRTILLTMLDA